MIKYSNSNHSDSSSIFTMYYELKRRQEKGKRRKKLGRGLSTYD